MGERGEPTVSVGHPRTCRAWSPRPETSRAGGGGGRCASENGLRPQAHGVLTGPQEGAAFQQEEEGAEEQARLRAQTELWSWGKTVWGPGTRMAGKGDAWRFTCICRRESPFRPSDRPGRVPAGS